jgi:hypothetical protein
MTRRSGWTTDRRERQRIAIQRWQPWTRSTGTKSKAGKAISSQNAKKPDDLIEVENYLRLLTLKRKLDDAMASQNPASREKAARLRLQIEEANQLLDPESKFARFLNASRDPDEEMWEF